MGNFRFYQDCKVTCWERDYFTVEADNYEEAEAIVRSWKCDDVTNINGGCPTMEIYNADGSAVINDVPDWEHNLKP